MRTELIVLIVVILIVVALIFMHGGKKSHHPVQSGRNSIRVRSSNDVVPPSDRLDEQRLQEFFDQLRSRIVSSKMPVKSSSATCENKVCRPLVKLTDVTFTEIPVIGAYGVPLLLQKYSGSTGGKDVIFIHGIGSSFLGMRNAFMNPWLLSHHNVYTFQERGAGAGPYPDPFGPQGGYDLTNTWADDLNAIITTIGSASGNVVLVGHSYGAVIIADYIRKYGQGMLAGLFLSEPLIEPVTTAYGFTSFDPSFLLLAVDVLTNGWVPDAHGWQTFIYDMTQFNEQNRWHHCDMYPNQGIEWGADPASWRHSITHQATLFHEPTPNLSSSGPPNPNLSDRFTTGVWPFVTVPTHILMGQDDKILRPATAYDLQAVIPGSKVTEVPCAGHHTYVDDRDAFNCALKKFLKHLH